MPRFTKKFKKEWDFFINPKTGFLTYNEICNTCKNDCRQSYRAELIACQNYEEKEETEEPIVKKSKGRKCR